jgi:hypothetical protein
MRKTLTKQEVINILRNELPYLKKKYGVEKVAIFGSFAKDKQNSRSDVDILVQLSKPLGLDFIELGYRLEDVLGRKIDLTTFDCLERGKEIPRYKHIAVDVEGTLIYV